MKPPRVSEILNPYAGYENVPADRLAEASERGTRRHAACSSITLGVLILRRNPEDDGYIQSFRDWFSRYVVRIILVSQRLYDPKLNFSGEPDFIFELVPMIPELHEGDLVVVDLKPEWTQSRPAWAAQCAAYLHLAQANKYPAKIAASLHPDQEGGPARLEWYRNSPRDFAGFLNALSAHNYFFNGRES
jgi:hypothetical protein